MTFKSMDELIRYIEQSVEECMPVIGKDMTEIMEDAIITDIYQDHYPKMYQRTGDLLDTPQVVDYGRHGITVEYNEENGDWESLVGEDKEFHFFPLAGYDVGKVWAEGGGYYEAHPLDTAFERCEDEIPDALKKLLRSEGIPIK